MIKSKFSHNLILLWLFVWPWSTKFIFRPAETNYLEIAFYLSSLLLLIPIIETVIGVLKTNRLKTRDTKVHPLWWWGVLIIFAVSLLSITWAIDQQLALARWLSLASSLFIFVFISRSSPSYRSRAVKVFLLGLVIPAFLGIVQFTFQFAPANKFLGLAAHNPADLGISVIETASGRFLRAYGSFDHPNIFGGLMAIAALFAFYLGIKEPDKKLRFFFLSAGLLFGLALLSSFSRSAWLAFGLGFLFIIITSRKTFWRHGKYFFLGSAVLLIIFVALFSPLFLTRVNPEARLEAKSLTERSALMTQAKTVIRQQPLTGTGIGGYIPTLIMINPSLSPWDYQPVHNYWLIIWAELGFFGLLGFILLWLGALKGSLKNKLWPFWLVLLGLSFFDHWFFTQPVTPLAILFVLGYLSATT